MTFFSHGRAGLRAGATAALAVLMCVGVASEAFAARKARATGFYRLSRGQVDLPLQFVISGPGNTGMHSIHIGFPNGDPMFDGDISLVGKSPAGLLLPENLVNGSYSALLPLMGSNVIQITTMFTVLQAPQASGGASLNAANGPGSFSFCPGATAGLPGSACPTTAGSVGTGFMQGGAPNLMTPPQGTGTRNGRLVYIGGSGFGGVSQVLLNGGGVTDRPRMGFGFGSPIFQAGHSPFGGAAGVTPQAIGGPPGFIDLNMLGAANYTQPRVAPTSSGSIGTNFGPFVTSMNALTSCPATSMGGAYPNIPLTGSLACVTGTGPLLLGNPGTTTNTGFPFTTGTVFAQQSTAVQGSDYFTVAGSDARTGRGIGNITLVAGGLALRTTVSGVQTGASVDTIRMTISEKTPSISPAGVAAAALLIVMAAGYAMRRRF